MYVCTQEFLVPREARREQGRTVWWGGGAGEGWGGWWWWGGMETSRKRRELNYDMYVYICMKIKWTSQPYFECKLKISLEIAC